MTVLSPPPPPRHAPDPTHFAARRLVIAPDSRHRTDIVIGAHHLEIGTRSVALDDIEAVSYSTHRGHTNLVQQRIRRRIRLETPEGALVLKLGEQRFGRHDGRRDAAVFDAIVRLLYERVEPRLRRLRVEHLRTGGQLWFGSLRLAPEGISVEGIRRATTWPWRSAPLAELRGDHVALTEGDRDERVVWRVDATTPDAVMLPELLWSAAAALL